MNSVIFNGSPRNAGNTAKAAGLLGEALIAKVIKPEENTISGCTECFRCIKIKDRPGCAVNDAMTVIYPQLLGADCIVLAAPIFMWSFSAQAKQFLDRMYCMLKYSGDGGYISLLEGKKAALLITAGGDENDGCDLAEESFKRFCEYFRLRYAGMLAHVSLEDTLDICDPEVIRKTEVFAARLKAF